MPEALLMARVVLLAAMCGCLIVILLVLLFPLRFERFLDWWERRK